MYKTQLFKNWYNGTGEINRWLQKNPNIIIISANTIANDAGGWGYIILYKENEAHE